MDTFINGQNASTDEKTITFTEYTSPTGAFHFHHAITESNNERLIGPESHCLFEVLYLIRGNLEYSIEGEHYTVEEGDVILVSPNEIHSLKIGNGSPYERIVVMFDIQMLGGVLSEERIPLHDLLFTNFQRFRVIKKEIAEKNKLKDLFLAIVKNEEHKEYAQLAFIADLIRLIIALDKLLVAENASFWNATTVAPVIKKIIEYINANIDTPLRLDDIAKYAYVSKSTVCHKFKQDMNISLNRYITIKKIYRAKELINDGMSAQQASVATGYENYNSFFYNYKKIIGTAPSDDKRKK